jgi:hypothetical protein
MSEIQYRFDGFCGQCGKNGNFVALGPWSLMVWVRESFLQVHGQHVPFELKVEKQSPSGTYLGTYDDVTNDERGESDEDRSEVATDDS